MHVDNGDSGLRPTIPPPIAYPANGQGELFCPLKYECVVNCGAGGKKHKGWVGGKGFLCLFQMETLDLFS